MSWEQRTITIDRTLSWVSSTPTWGEPKTRSGYRVLSLPEPAVHALTVLQAKPRADDGRIVATSTGGYPHPIALRRCLDGLCRRAKVRRLTVHQLRHQCASLLLAAGGDIKQVQHYLGPSRASVTLDIYAHLLGNGNAELAQRLERLLD